MTTITLPGDFTNGLTHLAGYGLASICEAANLGTVRLGWTSHGMPTQFVDVESTSDSEAIATAIRGLAQAISENSWATAALEQDPRSGIAAFSPRTKVAASLVDWNHHQAVRAESLDRLGSRHQWNHLELIAGLGEPAHWHWDAADKQPDRGASRWEMKTRNKGEEFIQNRFIPMARAVAQRSSSSILDSLNGSHEIDDLSDSFESRTSTGLMPPGRCDAVVAWCGLWGIASLPTIASRKNVATSPGMYPRGKTHPTHAILPVRMTPTSLALIRSTLLRREFDLAARSCVQDVVGPLDRLAATAARGWLAERGFNALVVFPVRKAGSASAPERYLLTGQRVSMP